VRQTRNDADRERQYRAGRARDLALRWLADDHPQQYRELLTLAREEVDRRREKAA
jgi:hypothetical protein